MNVDFNFSEEIVEVEIQANTKFILYGGVLYYLIIKII